MTPMAQTTAKNPYDLLGVKKTATDKEIRSAYRKLAKKLHPDVNPDDEAAAERFKEVTAAYNLLSNEALRKQYDSGAIDEQGQQRNPFAGAGGFGQRVAQLERLVVGEQGAGQHHRALGAAALHDHAGVRAHHLIRALAEDVPAGGGDLGHLGGHVHLGEEHAVGRA